MKADRITIWLSLTANLALLVVLLLLLLEIRQAINLSEADAHRSQGAELQEAMQALALSADLAEILAKARDSDLEKLTESEQIRLWGWEFAKSVRMQNQFNDYRLGHLDAQAYQAMLHNAAAAYPQWQALGIVIGDPAFADAIRSLRQRQPDMPPETETETP